MLSRRSVRIKVMQLLFALGRDEKLTYRQIKQNYKQVVTETIDLFAFAIYAITEITKHAQEDKKKRLSKHLISEEDKKFEDKFYTNEIVQSLLQTKFLQKKIDKLDFAGKMSEDFSRKIYSDFSKTEAYKNYISENSEITNHRDILLEAFRHCRKDEFFNEVMEDNFSCWVDDKSIIVGAIKKVVKAFPEADNAYFETLLPDKETVEIFGTKLLEHTHKQDKALLATIEPVLKNWESDRIAVVDMILMKMAVSEMMSFATIPTKVTLNEYVEIAKLYSTAKSKDFINGVLDKLKDDLEASGQIAKEGRGLDD